MSQTLAPCPADARHPLKVPADNQQTVLETLEAAGLEPDFGCRQGFCGACRVRLLSGKVSYRTAPLAWHGEDEILPCICQANTALEVAQD